MRCGHGAYDGRRIDRKAAPVERERPSKGLKIHPIEGVCRTIDERNHSDRSCGHAKTWLRQSPTLADLIKVRRHWRSIVLDNEAAMIAC